MPKKIACQSFDHVMSNPPYFEAGTTTLSADAVRKTAQTESIELSAWLRAGLRRVKTGGHLTVIHRAERLSSVLSALSGPAGDIRVLPISSRAGRPASRIIVRCRKGSRSVDRLLSPFIVHRGTKHGEVDDSHTDAARHVLWEGGDLFL